MPPPHPWFARYAWAVLLYNVAVVIWGAFVRASGSGAGCGNHWPLCNGVITPAGPTLKTIIEFTHRTTSGVDLIMVVIMLVWAFRAFPANHPVRRGALLSTVFLIVEALLGASLVLLEYVDKNQSTNRAWLQSSHLLNTLMLIASTALTAWWAQGHPYKKPHGKAAGMAAAGLLGVMLAGVSGAIAALGDTLFPASSFAKSFAQDFDPASSIFLRLRIWHPIISAATGAWLLFYGASNLNATLIRSKLGMALVLLVVAQIAAGGLNLILLAPVWMQLLHLLLANALWVALVLLCASTD